LLAAIGGAVGVAVAAVGVRALVAFSPHDLPRLSAIAVNARAFAFAFTLSAVVGVLAGMIPALHGRADDLQRTLQRAAWRATAGGRARRTLVVVEVAFALVLLVAAGLLYRSLDRLFAIPPGFASSPVLML